MNAEPVEHSERRRVRQSVAFHFNDDQIVHLLFDSGDFIDKPQVCVDGEPFGHGRVHQSDTVESVAQLWFQIQRIVTRIFCQEFGIFRRLWHTVCDSMRFLSVRPLLFLRLTSKKDTPLLS